MSRVDNNPNDNARRRRSKCMRCGKGQNLNTIPFRGRYLTVCDTCHRFLQS